jgi:hypothetical protein
MSLTFCSSIEVSTGCSTSRTFGEAGWEGPTSQNNQQLGLRFTLAPQGRRLARALADARASMEDASALDEILRRGVERASSVAEPNASDVKRRVGVIVPTA